MTEPLIAAGKRAADKVDRLHVHVHVLGHIAYAYRLCYVDVALHLTLVSFELVLVQVELAVELLFCVLIPV